MDTCLSKLIVLTRCNIVNGIKLDFKSNQTTIFWEAFGNKRFTNSKQCFENHTKKNYQTKPNVMFTQKLNNPNVDMDSSLMEPTYHSGQINLWKI
jgi:hypothetical protein